MFWGTEDLMVLTEDLGGPVLPAGDVGEEGRGGAVILPLLQES